MVCDDNIQGFGQQWCKVVVIGITGEPLIVAARDPEFRRRGIGECFAANLQSQVHSQPFDRHPVIVKLAASFGSLPFDSRRCVRDDDSRFGLVAMLPSRAPAAAVSNFGIAQQQFDRRLGRV